MNKNKKSTRSTRGALLMMAPGERISISQSKVRVSYVRGLASSLKRDFRRRFTVNIHDADDSIIVTRLI